MEHGEQILLMDHDGLIYIYTHIYIYTRIVLYSDHELHVYIYIYI